MTSEDLHKLYTASARLAVSIDLAVGVSIQIEQLAVLREISSKLDKLIALSTPVSSTAKKD